MIDSILDRQRRSIVIDKLLVKIDDLTTELVTEPERIKEATVRHFQTCALPPDTPPLPSQFIGNSNINLRITLMLIYIHRLP